MSRRGELAASIRRINARLARLSSDRQASVDLADPWRRLEAALAAAGSDDAAALAAIRRYEAQALGQIEGAAT